MPFAKWLYEQAFRNLAVNDSYGSGNWESLGEKEKREWEDYAKSVAAYFAR